MNLSNFLFRSSVHSLRRCLCVHEMRYEFYVARLIRHKGLSSCQYYSPCRFLCANPENRNNGVTRKLKNWKRENIYTIPNALCVLRIGMTPFIVLYIAQSHFAWSLAVFVLAGFSDLLDGVIARSFPSQRSNFGSILDPLADKLLVGSIFITLCVTSHLPLYLIILTAIKDFSLMFGAIAVRLRTLPPAEGSSTKFSFSRFFDPTISTVDVHPTVLGKMNTVLQLSLICTTLCSLAWPMETLAKLVHPLVVSTACTTVGAAVQYIVSMVRDK